ncbi:MAG: tRNA (N6-threonylcarbamoyladenosine(37)-N6)-methyltransferase TrmO [Proteobacteria bacterium]|nr:tRNA (N6-threonylcarbamoyladenosine(37)-N6)-methyltransferase TrmO [Pseudomonadota bacterium]
MTEITLRPIGVLRTPFRGPRDMPIQGALKPEAQGRAEFFEQFAAGLQDIDGFSHLILLYHFHLSTDYKLIVKPFLEDTERGVFATRAPRRPNPIGLSVVRLLRREGNVLHLAEVDMVDQTPLLDLKPLVPEFDFRQDVKTGWLGESLRREARERHTSDGRFLDSGTDK